MFFVSIGNATSPVTFLPALTDSYVSLSFWKANLQAYGEQHHCRLLRHWYTTQSPDYIFPTAIGYFPWPINRSTPCLPPAATVAYSVTAETLDCVFATSLDIFVSNDILCNAVLGRGYMEQCAMGMPHQVLIRYVHHHIQFFF